MSDDGERDVLSTEAAGVQRDVSTYRFTLAFEGIDLEDDTVMEALVAALPRGYWGMVDGEVRAEAFVDGAASAVDAARRVIQAVTTVVPDARPTRVVEDFVSTSDIADRLGMSRETVRLWSLGERGPGGFPAPRGVVSKGVKVWDWPSVNEWLQTLYGLGDSERLLSPAEIAEIQRDIDHEVDHEVERTRSVAIKYSSVRAPLEPATVRAQGAHGGHRRGWPAAHDERGT